jgi:hypothetical protein
LKLFDLKKAAQKSGLFLWYEAFVNYDAGERDAIARFARRNDMRVK